MMMTRELRWSWQDREIVLGMDEAGSGPLLLLLPALSSISTRAEMHPLMQRLAARFRVVALDWPGFGTAPRPALRWTPDALSAFLGHALAEARPPAPWYGHRGPAMPRPTSCTMPRGIPAVATGSRWWRRPGAARCPPWRAAIVRYLQTSVA